MIRPNPPVDLCKHAEGATCQICDPLPVSVIYELNRLAKRRGRCRQGLMPLRKRRKRRHKRLAKRGFGAASNEELYSSPVPGYGTKGTKYGLFYQDKDKDTES